MKYLSLFIFLLVSLANAQGFEDQLKDDLCGCMKELFVQAGQIERQIADMSCVENAISIRNQELAEYLLKEVDIDTIQNPYELGRDRGDKFMQSLIIDEQQYFLKHCEGYFVVLNNFRGKIIQLMKTKVTKEEMADLTKKIETLTLNEMFLLKRGINNMVLGKYEAALGDFDRCLEKDENNAGTKFFKAWTLELDKNYQPAIELYEQVYMANQDFMVKMALELTKYKAQIDY